VGAEIRHRTLPGLRSRVFSPRQADLMIVVGTITERQGPVLRRIYDQMCEPSGSSRSACGASTGGFYQKLLAMPGAIRSSLWTCTFPAARRGPSRCWMRWCWLQSGSKKGEGHSQVGAAGRGGLRGARRDHSADGETKEGAGASPSQAMAKII